MPVELSIGADRQLVIPGVTGICVGLDLLARFVPREANEDRLSAIPQDRSWRGNVRDHDSRGGRSGHMTVVVTTHIPISTMPAAGTRGWARKTCTSGWRYASTGATGCRSNQLPDTRSLPCN